MHSVFSEGSSSLEQLVTAAKQLGYSGICFVEYYKNDEQIKKLKTDIEKIKQKVGIEIFLGFEARNLKELSILKERRKRFDLLLVKGGDLRLNRESVESSEVDILTHPEFERQDCGMNHVLMKAAAKNNVAIEINFREVLFSNKRTRSMTLRNMTQNVQLAKKFKTPLIACSGALSHWDIIDPQCLTSFVSLLGLEFNEAKNTVTKVPEKIANKIKERRSEKWIMPGVKVVK
jgi:ribonuclease P/MRP protein subunit RPP1